MRPSFRRAGLYAAELGLCATLGCPALPSDSSPTATDDSSAGDNPGSDVETDSWERAADSEESSADAAGAGEEDSATSGALGQICSASDACASGSCVDGVCCGSSFCPDCEVCGSEGACLPAQKGTSCTTPNAPISACNGQGLCEEQGCSPGYLDCAPTKAYGCETPYGVFNCGACGVPCQPANVTSPVCSPSSGGCGYATCAPFDSYGNLYLDCDGNPANGCESAPSSDAHCGSCQNACGSNFFCGQSTPGVYVCVHD